MYTENNLIYEDITKQVLVSCTDKLIENITIPSSVQKIKENAFKDCILLKDINFGSGEALFLELASFPENNIKSLTLSPRIKDFIEMRGPGHFRDCINLENLLVINVSSDYDTFSEDLNAFFMEKENKILWGNSLQAINIEDTPDRCYCPIDGIGYVRHTISYRKGKLSLDFYPPGRKDKVFKIPENVINGFVEHNSYIEKIIFPKDFDFNINFAPVNNCKNLTTIIYDGPVMDFTNYKNAQYFRDCPNFKNIVVGKKTFVSKSTLDLIERYNLNLSYDTIDFEYILNNVKSFKEINNLYKER